MSSLHDKAMWAEVGYRHERAEQSMSQTRYDDKDTYPMTVITRLTHEDEASIRGIVADIEEGFNSNVPELLARHVHDDALIVNPVGAALRGPAAVEESARELLNGGPLADATAHYRLTDITLLSSDVAVAQKSAWSTPEEADVGAPPQMIALYVFIHRDGRWWVSRRQNTQVG